jgi:hypothetical protein
VNSRESIAVDGPNEVSIESLAWAATEDPQDANYIVEFEGASGPVVYDGKVYTYARYYDEYGIDSNSQVIAYDANSGELAWTALVEKAYQDSWSNPSIDIKHNTVIIGSRYRVYAFDAETGTLAWETQLDRQVVNATACVVIDTEYARAFITDFSPWSASGKLYSINLDPYEEGNPYEPGEIVWSETIGRTSGNSPAYRDGVIYAASVGGTIYGYEASAVIPNKVMETTVTATEGFFGGVTVTRSGYLYAATYNYDTSSGENNSTLCKVDCNDGVITWTTPTERTNSIPIVVGDRIYISGGVSGEFGSRPKVTAYRDDGNSVVKLWETPDDSNSIGGWSNQPVYANGKLYVGGFAETFSSYARFYILDVTLEPTDAGFIVSSFEGCGNDPAVTYDSIYSTGYDGLFKFRQLRFIGDVTGNGRVGAEDAVELSDHWLYDGAIGVQRSDLNLDGKINLKDFILFSRDFGRE